MAWIKSKIDLGAEGDHADVYAGGVALIATIGTVAALWSIGM
jgi:hypothetical protein